MFEGLFLSAACLGGAERNLADALLLCPDAAAEFRLVRFGSKAAHA